MFEHQDDQQFLVVRNAEGQHSVWFADRQLPPGWAAVGVSGTRGECLERITELWPDVSLRRAPADPDAPATPTAPATPRDA